MTQMLIALGIIFALSAGIAATAGCIPFALACAFCTVLMLAISMVNYFYGY